ncbi:MAG: type II toxin-antitoxin system VapC family toxin [Bacteroidetes bacterium]|nr:type II toxin-antitoxin system VapC family toxin [Bacteroidota bacterium]
MIPFDTLANEKAVEIHKDLKINNKLVEIPDLLIAATALSRGLKIATLNKKHFQRIQGLEVIA